MPMSAIGLFSGPITPQIPSRRVNHITRSQFRPNAPTHHPASSKMIAAPPTITPWQQFSSGLGTKVIAALLAGLVSVVPPLALPPPSYAVTNEQLLFLEAWRAVDRAYVDKKFNGQNWFKIREDSLKKVPMSSRKDTYAAIKGLLASLNDPFTRFLDPDQYGALR